MSAVAAASAIHERLARRLGEADEGVDQRGVIGRQRIVPRPRLTAGVPGPAPPSGFGAQLGEEEPGGVDGGGDPRRLAKHRTCLGE